MGHFLSNTLLTKDFMDSLNMMTLLLPSTEFLKLHFSFLGLEKVNRLFPFYFEKRK